MKNARDVLFRVGKILSIVFAIIYGIAAVIYLVVGVVGIITGIIGIIGDVDGAASALGGGIGSMIGAVFLIAIMVCTIINIKICEKAPVVNEKNTYILAIVFGVISCTVVGVVGGIFGLVLLNQQENANNAQTNNDNVVDAKVEEAKPAEETKEVAPVEEAKEETPAEETKTDDKPADSSDAE